MLTSKQTSVVLSSCSCYKEAVLAGNNSVCVCSTATFHSAIYKRSHPSLQMCRQSFQSFICVRESLCIFIHLLLHTLWVIRVTLCSQILWATFCYSSSIPKYILYLKLYIQMLQCLKSTVSLVNTKLYNVYHWAVKHSMPPH